MTHDFDVIVVGSGPAGVSAAYPLVESGLKVLMVDGGKKPSIDVPLNSFLTERFNNENQWEWIVGKNFQSINNNNHISPKFRVPRYSYVFENFNELNRIRADNFVAVGSLSEGGLSNTWGCGVARLSTKELSAYPFSTFDIEESYETITKRIGVSGACVDDLSDYFGLDEWSQPPIQLDFLHREMFKRYALRKSKLMKIGFRAGRSRVAVLSDKISDREPCNLLGNCLFGCQRKAIYSSADEIQLLLKHINFYHHSGFVVDRVFGCAEIAKVEGLHQSNYKSISAKKVILASGTLATTRIALLALQSDKILPLKTSPTAAFLLWLPRMLGAPREPAFGLGQMSFTLELENERYAFGSTFSALGIPASEFINRLPLSKRYGVELFGNLFSSCLLGNIFLPGDLSTTKISLSPKGELLIKGGYSELVPCLMSNTLNRLRKSFWQLGAIILPKSFTIAKPGGDIHYSGTLPMRSSPVLGETDAFGELVGQKNLFIADGSCLSYLSEKSHTLTVMANADRIARNIALNFKKF